MNDSASDSIDRRQHETSFEQDYDEHTDQESDVDFTRGGNVHGTERIGSGLLGAAVLAWGAQRRGVAGSLGIAAGLGLLARAASGQCAVKRALTPTPLSNSIARSQGWTTATVARATITINCPREEIYRLWRDFSRLPDFMPAIDHIEVITPLRSRWTVKAPLGKTMSWTSFVTADIPNERIAWESEVGAQVPNFGSVKFRDAPDGRGTEVRAMIAYQPPFRIVGRLLGAVLRSAPEQQMRDNLRRLKQIMETEQTTELHLGANS